jgi:hypothetical protein
MAETALLGRLGARREGDTVGVEGYLVVAQVGDRPLAETRTDGNGSFLLRLDPRDLPSVDLLVYAPDGKPVWQRTLGAVELERGVPLEVPVDPVAGEALAESGPARGWQVVDEGDLEALLQLVTRAVGEGLLRSGEADWIRADLDDLEHLYRLSLDVIEGSLSHLDGIGRILRGSPPWSLPDRWKPAPEMGGVDHGCFIRPRHPYAVMWGGIGLAVSWGDPRWVDRAAGWFLDRAHGLNSVFRAATGVFDGEMRLEQFAVAARSRGRPFSPGRGLPGPRPLPSIDELDLCELEWMNCAYSFWKGGPVATHTTPEEIARVQPDAVCTGYTGTIRLLPLPGETFSSLGTGWVLAIGAKVVQVLQQTPDWIDVQMPAGVPAGCTSVGWLLDVSETSAYMNEMRQACQRFFGDGAVTPLPPFLFRGDAPLSVVGHARVLRFYAGGQAGQFVAEACTAVDLEWAVGVDFCGGTTAHAETSLRVGGVTIASGLGLTGTYRVAEPADVTYTLQIETFAGATRCTIEERSVTVKRYKLLRAGVSGQVSLSVSRLLFAVDGGSPFSVQVASSCQAPAGGIPVTLVSSRPSRLAGGSVTIPQGAAQASFAATGQECGEVTLQVSAPGHQAATFTVLIVDQPQVASVAPAQVTACAPFTLTVTARCAGGPLGAEAGNPQVVVTGQGRQVAATVTGVATNAQDPFHGPSQIQAQLPGLDTGSYTASVSFRGKSGSAAVPLQVLPATPVIKSFTASPSSVVSCVPSAIQLSWSVEHATQVKLFKGTNQIANLNRAPSCASWTGAQAGGPVDRETEFRIEVMPPAGTPVTSKTLKISELHGIYSIAGSITLTNQSGKDLYIWSVNSVGTAADLEDLIFNGQSTTVQVAECLRINLVAETSGDETQLLKSTYTWRWSLAMLGRTGKVYPPQIIY